MAPANSDTSFASRLKSWDTTELTMLPQCFETQTEPTVRKSNMRDSFVTVSISRKLQVDPSIPFIKSAKPSTGFSFLPLTFIVFALYICTRSLNLLTKLRNTSPAAKPNAPLRCGCFTMTTCALGCDINRGMERGMFQPRQLRPPKAVNHRDSQSGLEPNNDWSAREKKLQNLSLKPLKQRAQQHVIFATVAGKLIFAILIHSSDSPNKCYLQGSIRLLWSWVHMIHMNHGYCIAPWLLSKLPQVLGCEQKCYAHSCIMFVLQSVKKSWFYSTWSNMQNRDATWDHRWSQVSGKPICISYIQLLDFCRVWFLTSYVLFNEKVFPCMYMKIPWFIAIFLLSLPSLP